MADKVYIIRLLADGRPGPYVSGYSNKEARPTTSNAIGHAKVFSSEDKATKWASRYLAAYKPVIIACG